ncbi:MAG TPA: hypothetical protein VGX25_00155 [Actinophytocola sp.]|uniref:hypothetical protein n=1 Tax=Actinophytocola sp. TaxID=1872138 RepID=UPI002DDD001D|nr:hypothetical protein [Actinophytocola sp.]HEV2777789.1 hypothetical protein [Actinophytocola sp.]
MPGLIVHSGMTMTCPHGGFASILPSGPPRVLVDGMPVATTANQIPVAGCAAQPTPDTKVQWVNVSARIVVDAQPVLLQAPPSGPGNAVCVGAAPPAPPVVAAMQVRVTGS